MAEANLRSISWQGQGRTELVNLAAHAATRQLVGHPRRVGDLFEF
jgi:hypothetical protein